MILLQRVVFGVCLTLVLEAQAQPPTQAALRKAFEANKGALAQVIGPKQMGPGVVVSAEGHVVTSVLHVGLYDAKVRVSGREFPAQVVLADAKLKLAVVTIQAKGEEFPIAPARLSTPWTQGQWVLGIRPNEKGDPAPVVGQVTRVPQGPSPFLETSLRLPPGSPIFDPQGRLIAVAVEKTQRGCRALPLPTIKTQLASIVANNP